MVYFISCLEHNVIKIGKAFEPIKRLGTLQIGCPCELKLIAILSHDAILSESLEKVANNWDEYIRGRSRSDPRFRGNSVEKALHKRFDYIRTRGEWFNDHPQLRDYIERNCETDSIKTSYGVFSLPISGYETPSRKKIKL